MKLLFVSNLFPDESDPVRGLDNATLLHNLREEKDYQIRVISPRPTPLPLKKPGNPKIKPRETDLCFLPKYVSVGYIPRAGSRWNDHLLERGIQKSFLQLICSWNPDMVLGSWLFPDGCALARLCAIRKLPLILITQGSDTHQYLKDPIRKKKIKSAIHSSRSVICRSGDLADQLAQAGVPREKLSVVYNGIDTGVFTPISRSEARSQAGIENDSPLLLFVGNLLPVKNPSFLLRAHAMLNQRRVPSGKPPATLCLVGQGPLRRTLEKETEELGTSAHTRWLGRLNPREVALWMNAADLFCLTSLNEGFPNVLLEAIACGLPIVSTDVGGIREKVNSPSIGRLVNLDDLPGYIEALEKTLDSRPMGAPISVDFSWKQVSGQYDQLLKDAARLESCR